MKMRSDEEFVKTVIINNLPNPPDSIVSGKNSAPDFTLHFDKSAVALEVTILSTLTETPGGVVTVRRTVDEYLDRLNDSFLKSYSTLVPEGQFVVIHFEGPVKKPPAYRRELAGLLDKRLRAGGFSKNEFETFQIADNKVQIRQHPIDHPARPKIVGIFSNSDSIIDIAYQAELLLDKSISRKSAIIERLNFCGEKWLGLLNAFFLADAETYRRALHSLNRQHCFSKLLLVSLDGSVEDLLK